MSKRSGRNSTLGQFLRAAGLATMLACTQSVTAQPAPNLLRSYSGSGALGWAVADIADLDGDGRADFIAGAVNSGTVVAFSSARATPLWSVAPGVGNYGWSVASAGDLNADGVSDVITGAPGAAGGGAVRVLSGVNGQTLRSISAPSGATQFGWAVSSIEDRNGDGVRDLLVGAPGGLGRVYILSGADGSELRSHSGVPGGQLGAGVARLADVDADGVSDYVVGAPTDTGGRAFVYSGRTGSLLHTLSPQTANGQFGEFFVADAGDVNADGTTDIYVGAYAETNNNGAAYVFSGLNGARIHRIAGTPGEGLGPGRGAGDVDGDGHADIVVGAYTFGGGGVSQGGRVGVFSGANLSFLMRVNGTRPGGQFGFDAVGLGDVNADGRLDFIVASSPASSVDLFAGVVDRPLLPANAQSNRSFTYWDASEPGWGYNLLHQGDLLYGTWYSYAEEDGRVMFLAVEATLQVDGSFAGPVYRIAGTPLAQINGTQAFTAVTLVGNAQMSFDAAGALSLSYNVFEIMQSKQLERFVFVDNPPTCYGSSESRSRASNFSDLWWNPLEAGWGLTLAHQGELIFVLWYTYGEGGRDQWLSASRMERQADGSYSGALQRPAMGTPLTQIDGPATSFPIPDIGSASLRFSDGENGVFSYTVDGVSQSKTITRFVVVAGNQSKPVCVP